MRRPGSSASARIHRCAKGSRACWPGAARTLPHEGALMIWIVLPAYNEEASLPRLLPKLDAKMRELTFEYRLVVINDGSTDKTGEILEGFRGSLPMDVLTHAL